MTIPYLPVPRYADMRILSVKRKKHFVGASEKYTLTISDSLGLRSIKLENGKTAEIYADDGEVRLKVSSLAASGYAESAEYVAPSGGDMSFSVETAYDLYSGAAYTIRRTDK